MYNNRRAEIRQVYTPNEIVQGIKSNDPKTKADMVKNAANTLRDNKYDYSLLVNAGIIEPLLKILATKKCSELLTNALSSLAMICYNSHKNIVSAVDEGAIPVLTALVDSRLSHLSVREEEDKNLQVKFILNDVIRLLGNMAEDGSDIRDAVLNEGALVSMLPFMRPNPESYLVSTAVEAFFNMCKKKINQPVVKLALVYPALPYIADLLASANTHSWHMTVSACNAITELVSELEYIESVQGVPKLTENIIAIMSASSSDMKIAASKVIARMLKGTDKQRDRCLDAGCMKHFTTYLKKREGSSDDSRLSEIAIEAATDILKGTHQQIRRAQDEHLLEALVQVLSFNNYGMIEILEVKMSALRAVRSIIAAGSNELIDEIIARHLYHFVSQLDACGFNEERISLVLEGLADMLKSKAAQGSAEVDELCIKLELMNVVDQIDALQHCKNEQVYMKTMHLIDTYFSTENAQP